MVEIVTKEVANHDLKGVVNRLVPGSIDKDIEKACSGIFQLHDVFVRKVKILRKPKLDLGKLMELHGESSSTTAGDGGFSGEKVDRPDGYEPPIQQSV